MRAEINIDTQEIIREITSEVIKAIKPLLNGKAEDDTIYTVKTLAEYIGVSSQWVYERVHLKEIPYIKMGKFPRFKKADIDKWLDSLKTPAINSLSATFKAVK